MNSVEDYVEKVMGCTPLCTPEPERDTYRTYLIGDELRMRLYFWTKDGVNIPYIGAVEWIQSGKPRKYDLLKDSLSVKEICRYLAHTAIEYSFS